MRLSLFGIGLLCTGLAGADALAGETSIELTGEVSAITPPEHELIPFEVPAGTREIEVRHDNLVDGNVLDWGLNAPGKAFRGWGGGNTEPAIVGEEAASRSYLTGPIEPGMWSVVIGKALIKTTPASYRITVILRDAPTLAPQPERRPYVASATLSTERRWYAGDLHVHSRESGDARPSIDEIATYAEERGLDFVEISDHNTTSSLDFIVDAQARHPKVLLVPGVEYTTYHGHANGIGATEFVDHKIGLHGMTIGAALNQFDYQGAVVSINHPTLELGDLCLGCAWEYDIPVDRPGAMELVSSGAPTQFTRSAIKLWDAALDQGGHIAAIGGSDDHRAGVDEGAFGTPIGTPLTMIYARELSVEALLEAIHNGHTVVRVAPDSPMVDMRLEQGTHLVATITGGEGHDAVVMKNGVELKRFELSQSTEKIDLDLTRPAMNERWDRYRIEMESIEGTRTITSHVWLDPYYPDDNSVDVGCGCGVVGHAPARRWSIVGLALVGALAVARRRSR